MSFPLFGFPLDLAQETQIVKTFQIHVCNWLQEVNSASCATSTTAPLMAGHRPEPRLDEAVDQLLCWCASKVREWRALARRDATFRIDFHQLLEDLAERTLRRLLSAP